jgi:hypothetical protein
MAYSKAKLSIAQHMKLFYKDTVMQYENIGINMLESGCCCSILTPKIPK